MATEVRRFVWDHHDVTGAGGNVAVAAGTDVVLPGLVGLDAPGLGGNAGGVVGYGHVIGSVWSASAEKGGPHHEGDAHGERQPHQHVVESLGVERPVRIEAHRTARLPAQAPAAACRVFGMVLAMSDAVVVPAPSEDPDRDAERLSEVELRILGCLLEKERTTPDDYPLTANSIMRAANQSTSRDPVVSYDVHLVERTVAELKVAGLVRFVHSQSNRSTKFRHVLDESWSLDGAELSLLGLLFLRGPQTVNELKTRSERWYEFGSPERVTQTLDRLAARDPALTIHLERQPGQKETRWAHLLGGPIDPAAWVAPSGAAGRGESRVGTDRIAALEAELEALRLVVERLCSELGVPFSEVAADASAPGVTPPS